MPNAYTCASPSPSIHPQSRRIVLEEIARGPGRPRAESHLVDASSRCEAQRPFRSYDSSSILFSIPNYDIRDANGAAEDKEAAPARAAIAACA